MWRSVWTILLTVVVAQGQLSTKITMGPQPISMDPMRWDVSWMQAYKEHSAWRRGTDEKILLIPDLNPTSPNVIVFWGPARPDNGKFVPTELEIWTDPGFAVSRIQYPQPRKVSFDRDGIRFLAIDQNHAKFYLRLHADSGLPLGDYAIRGRLTFQRIGRVGVSEPQKLDFNIPIKVVEHDAKITTDGRYSEDVTIAQKILIILLMPIIFPWALPNC